MWDKIDSLLWLLGTDSKGEGRTTALAICFITISIEKKRPVKAFDHYQYNEDKSMRECIYSLCRKLNIQTEMVLTEKGWLSFLETDNIKQLREVNIPDMLKTIMKED